MVWLLPPKAGRRKTGAEQLRELPAAASALGLQRGANCGFIKNGKSRVVALGQGAAPRNEAAVCVMAKGLELPHIANQLEVANALALAVENTNHLVVRALQGQFIQGG